MIALYIVCILILAIVLALWEIQIEGKRGWAASLPCWRKERGLVVRLLGGRPWTGYHTCMVVFLVLMFHFPFVLFAEWEFSKELLVWGAFFGLLLVEDFSWFVFNPHYGLKRFRKEEIWWHPTWWGPVPDFYWWYAAASAILIAASPMWF